MELVTTHSVPDQIKGQLEAELRTFVPITSVRTTIFQTADASSIIQLVGNLAEWITPFKAAVAIFLAQLVKRAADDIWDRRAQIAAALKERGVMPLRKFAATFARTHRESPIKTNIVIGIVVPDNNSKTVVISVPEIEEDAAWILARFIDTVEEIQALMKQLVAEGRAPTARATLYLLDDGRLTVRYTDPTTQKVTEELIDEFKQA